MNLRELIEELEDLAEEFGDEADVRLAIQPRWAFQHSIAQAIGVRLREHGEAQPVIYLGEGNQIGYLPHAPAVALGWAEARDGDEDEDDEAVGR